MGFYGGSVKNIRNVPGQCLDVHGGVNSHSRHVIFWACHNGANQGWYIDQKESEFSQYPLTDGTRFQIKSKMPGNRAVSLAEPYDVSQARLRIRDSDPFDLNQWWVFDWRTKTIRSASNLKNVISLPIINDWHSNGLNAVVREFKNEAQQQMGWFNGEFRNIRDVAGRCLDVYGGTNVHNQPIIFWGCHNGANQAWILDDKETNYPKQPLGDGVKFQIKSARKGRRAVVYNEFANYGSEQHQVKIQDNDPTDRRQWFVFDSRTQTIRAFYKKDYCLGNQLGLSFGPDQQVTLRPYKGVIGDRIQWHPGRSNNIRNHGGFCLHIHNNNNAHETTLHFSKCSNTKNEGWLLDQSRFKYKKNPLADGVKFQLRTKLSSGRAIFYHE